jgi:diguanylate cyclase (GGDEF)-like protein
MPGQLNLADFPDSPYARELERKPPRLRFERSLESAYVRRHLQRMRLRIRLWAMVVLAMTLGFGIGPLVQGTTLPGLLLFGGQLSIGITLVWLTWSPQFIRRYLPVACVIVPILHAMTAYFTAASVERGQAADVSVLVIAMISVFFFTGLLFRTSLITSVVTVATFMGAAFVMDVPQEVFLKSLTFVAIAGGLAAVMYRDVELAQRRAFLEEALFGELLERDGLTALKNRRAFDEHIARLWDQAVRDRRRLAFLFVDVDYFKRYNDEYGHQAGDATLKRVAQAIKRSAKRPLDMAARFGGEEFAVVLYDPEPGEVAPIADRLRWEVERLGIEHGASECAPVVTVSVGAGIVEAAPGRSAEGALQLADEALYKAKETGRNRCVVDGADEYAALVTGVYKVAALGR